MNIIPHTPYKVKVIKFAPINKPFMENLPAWTYL